MEKNPEKKEQEKEEQEKKEQEKKEPEEKEPEAKPQEKKEPVKTKLDNKINIKIPGSDRGYIADLPKDYPIRVPIDTSNFDNMSKFLSSSFNKALDTRIFNDNFEQIHAFNNSTLENQLRLSEEINELRRKLKNAVTELNEAKTDKQQKIETFEKVKSELTAKEKINHILSRISEDGRKKLLESSDFLGLFENSSKCDAVVISIDIRRSTELMLKARRPELFSKFITELSFKLSQVIITNFGIFDKFTGDGILAFFPKFYSGNEAMIRAIKAAKECHYIFNDHYNNSKDCFNVFIKDIGLGIGIDFGNVTLVNTQNELTVVGIPVVYACRFSGAKAGETILNQPAKEEIVNLCPTLVNITETEILIKNEGTAIAYNVTLNDAAFNIANPEWDKLTEEYKK
jgi:class 3 adenylate cyclase